MVEASSLGLAHALTDEEHSLGLLYPRVERSMSSLLFYPPSYTYALIYSSRNQRLHCERSYPRSSKSGMRIFLITEHSQAYSVSQGGRSFS